MSKTDMRREPADAKERKYIVEETGRCLCVEAGAGTGKTTLLVDRIMNLVLEEGARLRDIAAITFTEKAAGELKVRLREKLEEKLGEEAPELEDALRSALSDLEVCQVSTIHSFSANILRTRPVEAAVDPGFEVTDETGIRFITAEVWKSWLLEKLTAGDETLDLAAALGATTDKLETLAGMLYENRDLLSESEAHKLDEDETERLLALGEESIRVAVGEVQKILKRLGAVPDEPSMAQMSGLVGSWERYRRSPGKTELASLIAAVSGRKPRKTKTRDWAGTAEEFKEQLALREELQQKAARIVDQLGQLLAPALLLEILDYIDRVEEEKLKRGVLDFQDLLIKARDMLRDDMEARRYFQDRFSHILVDEFQDTDPLQAEIVFFLAEDEPKAKRWDDVRLKPGKLFIVGDPKQSIYRFRRADVEVYDLAKSAIGDHDATRYVTQNFRSVPGIIDWVNDVFGTVMKPTDGDAYQAEYRDIQCFTESGDEHAVRLVHNRDCENVSAEATRQREAEFLTHSIQELVSGGFEVRGKDGLRRPVTYRDICVLFRITTTVSIYERAFREHDIPFRTEGGRNFFTRQEVLDIRNAVCAIDDPYDAVSLVGVLRSPLFGVSDCELADFALGDGRFNYLYGRAAGAIGDAFGVLSALHVAKDSQPVSSTLESLLELTMAREVHAIEGGGEQTLANFEKLIAEARALEARQGLSFSDYAEWFSRMQQENIVAGESPVEEAGDDFIHIMSVHKAKGLEFPVVFLAGIGKGPNPKDVRVIPRHGTGEIGFKIASINTVGFDDLARWSAESEAAEECRVFYVSATRARDLLVVDDFQAKRTTSWFREILDGTGARSTCEPFEEEVDLASLEISGARAERITAKPDHSAIDIAAEERIWNDGIEKALDTGRDGIPTNTATGDESAPPPPQEERWPGLRLGKQAGGALHRIMELIDPAVGRDEVIALVRSVAAQYGIANREEQLTEMVENIMGSDLWRHAVASGRLRREMPFCVKSDDAYMAGTVDLVFIEKGDAVVVDYKSDNIAAAEVERRLEFYRPQGEFYASALGRVLGKPVGEVIFFFAAPGIECKLAGSPGL